MATTALMEVCKKGHYHEVALSIARLALNPKQSQINQKDNLGNTALHYAASQPDGRIVELLLTAGALSTPNDLGKTPLELSIESGYFRNFLILDKTATAKSAPQSPKIHDPFSPEQSSPTGDLLLMALKYNNHQCISYYLDLLTEKSEQLCHPLKMHPKLQSGLRAYQITQLRALATSTPLVSQKKILLQRLGKSGYFHPSIELNSLEDAYAQWLELKKVRAVDSYNDLRYFQNTHYRASRNSLGEDIDSTMVNCALPSGLTPLMIACHFGWRDNAIRLLENGANPDALSKNKRQAIHYALQSGSEEIILLLFRKMLSPPVFNSTYVDSPFHKICKLKFQSWGEARIKKLRKDWRNLSHHECVKQLALLEYWGFHLLDIEITNMTLIKPAKFYTQLQEKQNKWSLEISKALDTSKTENTERYQSSERDRKVSNAYQAALGHRITTGLEDSSLSKSQMDALENIVFPRLKRRYGEQYKKHGQWKGVFELMKKEITALAMKESIFPRTGYILDPNRVDIYNTTMRCISDYCAHESASKHFGCSIGCLKHTRELYREYLAYYFLAATDDTEIRHQGQQPEWVFLEFIRALALNQRAHNWDESEMTYDNLGQPKGEKPVDDMENDCPSCPDGTIGRVARSVIGNSYTHLPVRPIIDIKNRAFSFVIKRFSELDQFEKKAITKCVYWFHILLQEDIEGSKISFYEFQLYKIFIQKMIGNDFIKILGQDYGSQFKTIFIDIACFELSSLANHYSRMKEISQFTRHEEEDLTIDELSKQFETLELTSIPVGKSRLTWFRSRF